MMSVGHIAPLSVQPRKARHVKVPPRQNLRADIQALRALAVTAVVFNHLWPERLTGGYVGVDIFFVISGFLITTHLLKELRTTQKIQIGSFYGRRILRLLPAALFVILTSAICTRLFLPYPQWETNARDFIASMLYAENWLLAARSIDYSAQSEAATAAQHYWSLSVEEQFYLIWPLLLLGIATVSKRWFPGKQKNVLVTSLILCIIAFLWISYNFTHSNPNEAYFVTHTRVWEFALGGLVASIGSAMVVRKYVAEILTIVGMGLLVYSIFSFGTETIFPGVMAFIPAGGTALVIFAGRSQILASHAPLAVKPIQWIGDISYSLYLWHWPLIIIFPFIINSSLSTIDKLIIGTASVLLAWLTKIFIEDPARRWKWALRRTWRPFALMAITITVLVALCMGLIWQTHRSEQQAADAAAAFITSECAGPKNLNKNCTDPFAPAYDPVMGPSNEYWTPAHECGPLGSTLQVEDTMTTRECDFSDGGEPTRRVWLLGDSHAQQWESAIWEIARQEKWFVTTSYLGACPPLLMESDLSPTPETCTRWRLDLRDEVLADNPDLVITSALTKTVPIDDGTGRPQPEQYQTAFQNLWSPWLAQGIQVAVISDPPLNGDVRDPNCVLQHPLDPQKCVVSRTLAAPLDPMTEAARNTAGVDLIEVTDKFCDETSCYAVIGRIPIYFDQNHLNRQYVRLLAPTILQMLGDHSHR